MAANMMWKGKHPVIKLVHETYEIGVKPTQKAMSQIERQIERLTNSTNKLFPNLGNWFIDRSFSERV